MQRYASQMIIPGMGTEGQQKIAAAKVLVVGAGGLGCPVLSYMAAMGIGTIGIADNDKVQLQNLHRQVLYTEADIGKLKVLVAKERLQQQNSTIRIQTHQLRVAGINAAALISEYDIVIDCCDNISTRYVINDATALLGKPFIYGAVKQYEGQLAVFNYCNGPSYRDLFDENLPGITEADCTAAGIMGYVTGAIGCMQVNEAVKIILGAADVLSGVILTADFEKAVFRKFIVRKHM